MIAIYANLSHKISRLLSILLGLISLILAGLYTNPTYVGAAACPAEPSSTTGRASQTIEITEAGTYTVWSRMKAPDSSPVEYTAYIDGQCFVVGQTVLPTDALTWVDYQNGVTTDKVTIDLSSGQHTLVMTAGSEGLELDRVMLLADTCVPSNTGDNCQLDTQNPNVSLTTPSDGATLTTNTILTANASDNDSVDYVEFYYGSTLLGSDNSQPYNFDWDTTEVSDGAYVLTARAYDMSGNSANSAAVNVTVANTPDPVDATITSFTATPATVTVGDEVTLAWEVAQGVDCTINQDVGTVGTSGTRTVTPSATTTFTLACDGTNGGNNATADATVTVNPAPLDDTDNDGVWDYIENNGPNGGDANHDGISDSQQSGVVTLVNAKTGEYNILAAEGNCEQFRDVTSTTGEEIDNVHGIWSYRLLCDSNGGSADVTIYLDNTYDTTQWRALKLSHDLQNRADITDLVDFELRQLGSSTVSALSYSLTDGGVLDEDGLADGIIIDPFTIQLTAYEDDGSTGGGGSADGVTEDDNENELADTGVDMMLYVGSGISLLLSGFWLAQQSRSRVIETRKG